MQNKEVFDMSEGAQNLADVDYILTNIIPILKHSKEANIQELKKNSYDEYKMHMEEKFSKFSGEYYSVFQKVISGDDLTPLLKMLSMINKIKKEEFSLEKAEKMVMNELGNSFISRK